MNATTEEIIQNVIGIAEQASSEILRVYRSGFDIEKKQDNTPVTCADLAAHNIIFDSLEQLTPNIPILSEESANISFEERKKWTTYWLVDPLDGTREFIHRTDEFTVNIALIENHKAILGVIYVPVTGTCYYASKGNGAWKIIHGKPATRITTREASKEISVIASSRSVNDRATCDLLKKIGKHHITTMGSSLKSCLVAEGRADLYPRLGPTSEWDTAAAQCIIEEAGGAITDTHMKPLQYNTKESLLNPDFFAFGDKSLHWNKFL